jgi:uncharacterized membrane protein YfcA
VRGLRPAEYIYILVLGVMFGVLIGVGISSETRVLIIRALALFLIISMIAYLWTNRHR